MDLNYKDPSSEIRKYLSNFEQLEWAGIPKQGIQFNSGDKYMVPFSLFWCGFAVFWEFMAYIMGAPFFFLLFGIPFILVGIYLIFGRFIVSSITRKNTFYGITNDRIIFVSGRNNKNMQSINLKSLENISFSEMKDGFGTITFSSGEPIEEPRGQMQFKGLNSGFSLQLIPYVKRVYLKIVDLKNRQTEAIA